MLMLTFLVLMPAAVLASCSESTPWRIFMLANSNKDSYLGKKEINAFMAKADINHDEVITDEEVTKVILPLFESPDLSVSLQEVFNMFDANKNEEITSADIDDIYGQFDGDKDGFFSVPEYLKFIKVVCKDDRSWG